MTDIDTGLNMWQMQSNHNRMWDVVQRQSTLQSADAWVQGRERCELINGPRRTYAIKDIKHLDRDVHFFGDHVAFDRDAWHKVGRSASKAK